MRAKFLLSSSFNFLVILNDKEVDEGDGSLTILADFNTESYAIRFSLYSLKVCRRMTLTAAAILIIPLIPLRWSSSILLLIFRHNFFNFSLYLSAEML